MLFYKVRDGETDRRRLYRCNGCAVETWDTDAEYAGWQALARMGTPESHDQHFCPRCQGQGKGVLVETGTVDSKFYAPSLTGVSGGLNYLNNP